MSKNKSSKIPEPVFANDEKLKISFEFYDTENTKYCLSKLEQEKVAEALIRLKEINGKTYNEIHRDRWSFNFHPVDWSETKEKNGFPYERVNEFDPFQIALKNVNEQKARAFGGLHNGVFYIVWLDLDHEIDPCAKKHT